MPIWMQDRQVGDKLGSVNNYPHMLLQVVVSRLSIHNWGKDLDNVSLAQAMLSDLPQH